MVVSPFDPWIETTGGTVGVLGNIDAERDGLPSGEYNASYTVYSQGSNIDDNFTSAKNWLVETYSFHPESLENSLDIYTDLLEIYRSRGIGTVDPGGASSRLNAGQVVSTMVSTDSNIVLFTPPSGTAEITAAGFSFGGQSGVVFIDGNLNIDGVVKITISSRALIFIVNGAITVDSDVDEIDGIFVSNNTGAFNSGSGTNQLVVNGSVLAFGGVDFGRDLSGSDNEDTPAELIQYQPSYLWILREIAGETTIGFKELTP